MTEITATDTVISIIPDNPSKDEVNKKIRLEYKTFLLETRKERYGTVVFLEKEFDLARVNGEFTEMDVFIGAIEVQKATLPS